MEDVLDETVAEEDLRVRAIRRVLTIKSFVNVSNFGRLMRQKFERRYHDALAQGTVTHTIQFEYAWCLIRSKYPTDVKRGIFLLEDLSKNGTDNGKRDCIYYLAIGNAKLKVPTMTLPSLNGLT